MSADDLHGPVTANSLVLGNGLAMAGKAVGIVVSGTGHLNDAGGFAPLFHETGSFPAIAGLCVVMTFCVL